MTPFYHALDTGTLAAWLSVAGFGVVGVLVPDVRTTPPSPSSAATQVQWVEPEILLGNADAAENPAPAPPAAAAEVLPSLPAPPELSPAVTEPLPEIPDLPPAPPAAAPAKPAPSAPTRPRPQASRPAGGSATATATATSGSASSASGTGMAAGDRLAAGRMPSPHYPAESRRKGQEGTVTVEFTVDSSGRVISAVAKSPSPWPLLNEEAVATVRRWRFPPGGVMKLQRPIVFQLR